MHESNLKNLNLKLLLNGKGNHHQRLLKDFTFTGILRKKYF